MHYVSSSILCDNKQEKTNDTGHLIYQIRNLDGHKLYLIMLSGNP